MVLKGLSALWQVLQQLRGIVTEVIGCEVGDDEPLMAAGLDSLAAVELQSRVGSAFAVPLPATVALDYPTLKVHLLSRRLCLGAYWADVLTKMSAQGCPTVVYSWHVSGGSPDLSRVYTYPGCVASAQESVLFGRSLGS